MAQLRPNSGDSCPEPMILQFLHRCSTSKTLYQEYLIAIRVIKIKPLYA